MLDDWDYVHGWGKEFFFDTTINVGSGVHRILYPTSNGDPWGTALGAWT
jgi:hypothetical protein